MLIILWSSDVPVALEMLGSMTTKICIRYNLIPNAYLDFWIQFYFNKECIIKNQESSKGFILVEYQISWNNYMKRTLRNQKWSYISQ